MEVEEKVLESSELVELMDGVVEHFLSEPVDTDGLMVEDVVVQCTSEVASVL